MARFDYKITLFEGDIDALLDRDDPEFESTVQKIIEQARKQGYEQIGGKKSGP